MTNSDEKFTWREGQIEILEQPEKEPQSTMKQLIMALLSLKGGPGSGNWGHAGRPGKVGGSTSTSGIGGAMSIRTGPTAKARQQEAATAGRDFQGEHIIPVNADTKAKILRNLIGPGSSDWDKQEAERRVQLLKDLIEDAPVAIKVPSDVLPEILEDGRFKNQHETETSGGYLDPDYRAEVERAAFGDDLTDPTDFPVYGYVDTAKNGYDVSVAVVNYGDAKVTLKESVKDRTTITAEDSIEHFYDEDMVGTPFRNPGIEGIDGVVPGARGGYVEAQIHGGVKVSDIASIEFRYDASDFLKAELDAKGIPYTTLRKFG